MGATPTRHCSVIGGFFDAGRELLETGRGITVVAIDTVPDLFRPGELQLFDTRSVVNGMRDAIHKGRVAATIAAEVLHLR